VIIKQEDLIANTVTFAKNAGTVANHNKDYISTVLLTQKQMMKVVPIRPDQVNYFFNNDNSPLCVQTVAKVFERLKETKHMLVKNWLQAALVAQGTTKNADSMSQLQIEPDMPNAFTPEQSETFYTAIRIGFNKTDHTFGTTVANGLLNYLHPCFIPEPETADTDQEVIDVENTDDCQVRTRTDTANDGLLQRLLHMEEQLAAQTQLNNKLRQTLATTNQNPQQPPPTFNNPLTQAPSIGANHMGNDNPFTKTLFHQGSS
jgi:hypothetical protein